MYCAYRSCESRLVLAINAEINNRYVCDTSLYVNLFKGMVHYCNNVTNDPAVATQTGILGVVHIAIVSLASK